MKKNRKIALALVVVLGVVCLPISPVFAENKYVVGGSEWGLGVTNGQYVGFTVTGKIRGFGGCNRFFGKYTNNGNNIKIGRLGATRKYCGAKVSASERQFLKKLGAARKVDFSHILLKLYDSKGKLLLKLRRRDWD